MAIKEHLLSWTLAFIAFALSAQETQKPNIIYILADDMGYGDCSLNGQRLFPTPNIDRIGTEGIIFTDHYASSAVCAPSRTSLMTGKHQGHATVRGNFSVRTGNRVSIGAGEPIIPELLKEAGYTTGIFGKWGLGEEGTAHTPTQRGFDEWFGYLNQKAAHNHYPVSLFRGTKKIPVPENASGNKGAYSQDLFTRQAKEFIKKEKNRPFFLYLAYTLPHANMEVPADDLEKWLDIFGNDTSKATFAAMITRMDRHIGEIMRLLKQEGIDKQTIIMFSSDNGPHSKDGHSPEFFNSASGFRGRKRDLYEGGIRVPFFVRWPSRIQGGQTSSHISAQYDVMATLADLLGIPVPQNTDGISFLPTLLGKRQVEHHRYLYWEFIHNQETRQAVRFGNIKAIRNGLRSSVEIYDLKSDPGEGQDLAELRPDLVARALSYFREAHVNNPEFPFIEPAEIAPCRLKENLNAEWTFNYFPENKIDTGIANRNFDDSGWQAIALPHTWQTYETTRDIHPFIKNASERQDPYWWNGWGWYRKRISIDASLQGKKFFLEFDGVQKIAQIFVNGRFVKQHKGGYNSFYVDITPFLEIGKENIIAVCVSGRRDDPDRTPPMTAGNFNVYGGIYRDVRLVVKNKVHIPYQGTYEHEGGTFITTPFVSEEKSLVHITTYVKNEREHPLHVRLETILKDNRGKEITTCYSEQMIPAGAIVPYRQQTDTIYNPHLWSPDSPAMYRVTSNVYVGETLVDTYVSPLGFRWFRWDYSSNELYVNGKKTHIHGTNRHQEFPWLGDAIPNWIIKMDMDDIRYRLGHNFMRTGHYPNAPYQYAYNDMNGIITVEEVPNIKSIDFNEKTQENNVRAMIRRDRNHPSIFFWSVGNETNDAADSKWVFEEDTTRIIHQRKAENYGDFVNHDHTNLDMENLLRVTIRGWMDNDTKNLHPTNREGVAKSGQLAGNEVHQHVMARVDNGSIRGRIDKNIVAWLYADHGCDRIYKNSPLQHVNAKGWVDMYRVPKYMYYLWQANWGPQPMVFIQPHFWRKQYLGQRKSFQVDSNCEVVELFANGVSLGKKFPRKANFFTVTFDSILVERGTLRAVAYNQGNKAAEWEVTMAKDPARIVLKTDQRQLVADRSGIAIITADIVDQDGTHIFGARNPLTWEVRGEGGLVGHSLYETDFDKNLEEEGTGYIDVPVSNVIRSTSRPGKIYVRVSSPGLQSGEISLESILPPPSLNQNLIIQPKLDDGGREITKRDTSYRHTIRYREEIKEIRVNKRIEGQTTAEYKKGICRFIIERHPHLDTSSIEWNTLLHAFTDLLHKMNGEIIADDYNFLIRSFNECRMICRYLDDKGFNPVYREQLKAYYATQLISKGISLDPEQETGRFKQLPGDIRIIKLRKEIAGAPPLEYHPTQHFYFISSNSIIEAIQLLEKNRIPAQRIPELMDQIKLINPHVHWGDRNGIKEVPIAVPKH